MIVANAYAPNGQGEDKKAFFEEIHQLINDSSTNFNCQKLILAGDLNLVFNASEVKNRAFNQAEERMSQLAKGLFDSLNLVDGWDFAQRKCYTWMTNRTGQEVFSTLDRIMFTQEGLILKEKLTDWSFSVSDHAAVVATFNFNTQAKNNNPMSSRLDPKLPQVYKPLNLILVLHDLCDQISMGWLRTG